MHPQIHSLINKSTATISATSMRRSVELLPLLLLVVVASLGVWPPTAAAQSIFGFRRFDCSEEEAQWFCRSWPRPRPRPRAPSPPHVAALRQPTVKECLGPASAVKGCVRSLLTSRSSGELRVAPGCCRAVRKTPDQCFDTVGTRFHFSRPFAARLQAYCLMQADD